jgi:hypothetical protein
MATEREIVALLYRADWRRLSLSGVVHGSSSSDETVEVAPGKRYRMENADGSRVRGCDGERIWRWFAGPPPDTDVSFAGGPQPPFPVLLIPSWLLSGYSLSVEDETTVCGRAGVRVVATALARPAGKPMLGMLPAAAFPWPPFVLYEHAVVVVDAELGILLRCEGQRAEDGPDVTEFRTLAVGAEVDPERFTAPEGSVVGDGSGSGSSWSVGPFEGHGWPFGAAGREAAKTVGGLAAGGLGAALRYAPQKRQDSFAQATEDADPEPAMPADDPVPGLAGDGPGAPVSDEVLHALYRSGLGVPRFTATLHQWMDGAALLEAVPESARRAGFGGTGLLVDALRDKARDAGAEHLVRAIRIGGWDKYRIDLTYPAPPADQDHREWRHRHRSGPRTIACDGQRRWDVYLERVVVRPAGPLPDEIATLIDGSWLLGCDLSALSGGEEVVVAGGRRGYRVVAEEWHRPPALPGMFAMFFAGLFLPAVAVVDAESGRLLRVTMYKGGKPVVRHELRDFAAEDSGSGSGSGDFGFTPPAGLRIVEESPDDESHAPPNPLESVAKAARGFLGSLRGTNGRLRFWGEEQAAVCH